MKPGNFLHQYSIMLSQYSSRSMIQVYLNCPGYSAITIRYVTWQFSPRYKYSHFITWLNPDFSISRSIYNRNNISNWSHIITMSVALLILYNGYAIDTFIEVDFLWLWALMPRQLILCHVMDQTYLDQGLDWIGLQ